jgi:hypothetical protein
LSDPDQFTGRIRHGHQLRVDRLAQV